MFKLYKRKRKIIVVYKYNKFYFNTLDSAFRFIKQILQKEDEKVVKPWAK